MTLQGLPVTLQEMDLTDGVVNQIDCEMGVYVVGYRMSHQVPWEGDTLALDMRIILYGQIRRA